MTNPCAGQGSGSEESTKEVNADKKVDLLQATFQHFADVGLDHQRQAATTSNILLAISGAILTLVGVDGQLVGVGDALGAGAVATIGGFGMAWSWKQHEKYDYWTNIATKYQTHLAQLVPEFMEARSFRQEALSASADDFGDFVAYNLEVRYLWVMLHGVVMVLGIVLAVAVLWIAERYAEALALGLVLIYAMSRTLRIVVNIRDFRGLIRMIIGFLFVP